jgi:hypothetical protein
MTKSETRGNGTPASVHLLLQGKGDVGNGFVSTILAQYSRRSLSTTVAQPTSNDLSQVEALSHGLGARQGGDFWVGEVERRSKSSTTAGACCRVRPAPPTIFTRTAKACRGDV